MDTKLQFLFDMYEGKSERQKTLEELYITNGVDFDPVFEEALKLTLEDTTPEIFRGRGFMATHMNWHLVGLLKQKYKDKMSVDKFKRDYYRLNENVRIYFKKLNNNFAPENVVTDHVKELNSLFGCDDKTTVLYAGFNIERNKNWNELAGTYLVEMKTLKKTNWVSDLTELSYKINKSTIYTPMTLIELPDEIILTHKNKDVDLGNTNTGG